MAWTGAGTPERRRDLFDAFDALADEHNFDLRRLCTPETADQHRARFAQRLMRDPLLEQFRQAQAADRRARPDARGAMRLTAPWMALAEQRMWALAYAGDYQPMTFPGVAQPETMLRMEHVALLLMAQTYLWTEKVLQTVMACPMPSHVIGRDLMPFPVMYHTFESAHSVQLPPGARGYEDVELPADAIADWVLLHHQPRQIATSMPVSDWAASPEARGTIQTLLATVPYGVRFPEDIAAPARHGVNLVLSMLAFLNSPYVNVTERPMPRQWRRHAEGVEAQQALEGLVAVVELRAEAQEAVEAYNAEAPAWKHRWWVRGHFRKQWHPSTQTHELTWIAPFLKGPADAPMLQKVYAVRR